MNKQGNPSARAHPLGDQLARQTSGCMACPIREMAICSTLNDSEMAAFQEILSHVTLQAGRALFYEGDEAHYVYNVMRGTLRLSKLLSDGRRQITGFLVSGDFLGFARGNSYSYDAEAVTDVQLCRFPVREFEKVCDTFPKLEKRLLEQASNELAEAQDQMLLLGRQAPQERLAKFIVRLSERAERVGMSGNPVRLSMTRHDIADYLGLTIETVSRCFTKMRKDGIIELPEPNIVVIKQPDALSDLTV